ncbi:hypothetical protein BDW75DRAFT_219520 [Aspergillus navahoensis]
MPFVPGKLHQASPQKRLSFKTCWPETPTLHEFLPQTMMCGLISFSVRVQPRLMIQHLT